MRIEIICTGDEVLTGKTVNTNFSHISRKLEEAGLSVLRGTTVGDDRDTLLEAFRLAGERSDIVIVNGGLGPTVDDLSQEVAAAAAGVDLVMNSEWLERMEALFRRYKLVMQENNRKQALLPSNAEMIDNPIGSACGFEMTIGQARFYFTPGVPKELKRMLDEQIIPRVRARAGVTTMSQVKRFHSFGLGESHADSMLADLAPALRERNVKLGFQSHYPQLETKLTLRGTSRSDISQRLSAVESAVRERLGNFIVAEDDASLETVILDALQRGQGSLTVAEAHTSGRIAARLAQLAGAWGVNVRGSVATSMFDTETLLGLERGVLTTGSLTASMMESAVRTLLEHAGSTHALVVLADSDATPDGTVPGRTFWFAVADEKQVRVRTARLLRIGDDEWLRLGAVEMGLDCIRRFLQGLPVDQKTDFG